LQQRTLEEQVRALGSGLHDLRVAKAVLVAVTDAAEHEPIAVYGSPEDLLVRLIPKGVPAVVQATHAVAQGPGRVLRIGARSRPPAWLDREECANAGIERALWQSLDSGGELAGVLLLAGIPAAWDSRERLEQVWLLSTTAVLAMEREWSRAQRRRVEDEVVHSQNGRLRVLRQWASTLDAMPELIAIADLNGVITRVNRAVAERLGLRFQQIIGRTVNDLFGPLPVPAAAAGMGLAQVSEATLPFTEGLYQLSCFPNFDPDGQRIGVIYVFHDITEERRVRERLLQAEKLQTLSAVLSGVAHEMNNPLAGVLGFAQLAAELNQDPAVAECLDTVQAEADRVSRIVRNLLDFVRRSRPTQRPVSLADVIVRTRDLLAYEMRLSRVSLEVSMPDDLPAVFGDAQQFEQVLVSIFLLAIHDSARRKEPQQIRLAARESGGRVLVEVETQGPTLEPAQVAHLFELSGDAGRGEADREMGLALAYGIVSQHGGRLGVLPMPEGGLRFSLELPAATEVSEAADPREEEPAFEAGGVRALVADDDESAARLIEQVLRRAGARVDLVSDGRMAWERLREREYDLVVLDFRMPQVDARELLSRLQAAGRREAHRVVLVSGDTLNRETNEFVERSGLPFVAKPFALTALRRAIRRVLRNPSR